MSEISKGKLLLVDDHHVIRAGLTTLLSANGWDDIYQASSFTSASELISRERFQIILTDHYLGDGEGLNLANLARRDNAEAKIALFTFEANWELIQRARALGFSLFISKQTSLNTIVTALDEAMHTRDAMAIYAPSLPREGAILSPLTKSEIEVLSLMSKGLTAREIASIRFNSEATIKSHVAAILRKLESRNRVEAIRRARELNLISTL
jgi:DNA-binding NarL/FixJ family response regulator